MIYDHVFVCSGDSHDFQARFIFLSAGKANLACIVHLYQGTPTDAMVQHASDCTDNGSAGLKHSSACLIYMTQVL